MEIHAPVPVLRVVWRTTKGVIRMVRARRSTAALALLEAWVMLFLPRTTFWWSAMVGRVPLSRESARTAVHTLDVI